MVKALNTLTAFNLSNDDGKILTGSAKNGENIRKAVHFVNSMHRVLSQVIENKNYPVRDWAQPFMLDILGGLQVDNGIVFDTTLLKSTSFRDILQDSNSSSPKGWRQGNKNDVVDFLNNVYRTLNPPVNPGYNKPAEKHTSIGKDGKIKVTP